MSVYQEFELDHGKVVNVRGRMLQKLDAIPLPDVKGLSVLDIGTDFGFWAFTAAWRGAREVVGLDRNRDGMDLIDRNNRLAAEHARCCRFYRQDVGREWSDRGTFDLVLLFSLYHHIYERCADHNAIWFWLHRQCAPGGTLMWENPVDASDPVVRKNVTHPYLREEIIEAASRYFVAEYVGAAIHEPTREVWRCEPKALEMIRHVGIPVDGAGGASKAFLWHGGRRIRQLCRVLGDSSMCPGSLNLISVKDFDWSTGYVRAEISDVVDRSKGVDSPWAPRWARLYPVTLEQNVTIHPVDAWVFRFEGERYPDTNVELISPHRLRDYLTGPTVRFSRLDA